MLKLYVKTSCKTVILVNFKQIINNCLKKSELSFYNLILFAFISSIQNNEMNNMGILGYSYSVVTILSNHVDHLHSSVPHFLT